jgi:galactokinase/mevalonate kinase-like predicted kinase
MKKTSPSLQHLLSLPARMAENFERLEQRCQPDWIAASDPPGTRLGSGGGTVHLLLHSWKKAANGQSFHDWLCGSRKLIIHGGGQGRKLPAYAPVGRFLMPLPVVRWSRGQRLTQTLLEVQLPDYERVLAHAPEGTVAMVASGDVILRFARELPRFPKADVLGLGMWVTPEVAQNFGVFFCPRQKPSELAFFLQKPHPAKIRELGLENLYLVDTGMWLLSERAVDVLLKKCGCNPSHPDGAPLNPYELYHQFALALGRSPSVDDPEIRALTTAVVPLPGAEFYHFGATRRMIESISALQNRELDETKLGMMGAKRHPDQYLQNSRFEYPLRLDENHTLWIENSAIPASWKLGSDHVLTGVPDNQWDLSLESGVCFDFAPVDQSAFAVRFYHIDDQFGGGISDPLTLWMGRPALQWFKARGINLDEAGIGKDADVFEAPLFPVIPADELEPRFIEWLVSSVPVASETHRKRWLAMERVSADQIIERVNLDRLYQERSKRRELCLQPMMRNHRWSVFYKLDLESTARLYAQTAMPLPPSGPASDAGMEPMQRVREKMFRASVMRHRQEEGWPQYEEEAFAHLRSMIVRDAQLAPVTPHCCVLEDQIVWGRSPVRLDLAGGWSDTPPYCLENGGRVVNLAVDLNGQPPIQVFAKLCDRPQLVMRSIDLGVERTVTSYEELNTYAEPGNAFALAKAAFALAGFLPKFNAVNGQTTLEAQLKAFGGGIEVSLLSAVPKGSGLGTSSILASTLLATLSDVCGLNWDRNVLFTRTLALEQMLTTGGGWQDQVGGIYRGFKMIETTPGLAQKMTLRWLPEHLFASDYANRSILLYYTGLTRLAKNILKEIVRGIFLNSPAHIRLVEEIGANAMVAFNAAQRDDYPALAAAVRQSWELNQRLDSGTNPEPVQAILNPVWDYLDATKLLGAGGGGYLLMMAKDERAAGKIRQVLTANPPNPRARFVNFSVSETGLQLTRS